MRSLLLFFLSVSAFADAPPKWWKDLEPEVWKHFSGASKNGEADLLAWHVKEDQRPLRVVSALVWAKGTASDGKPKWALMNFYQHPADGPDWRPAIVYDGRYLPVVESAFAPKNEHVYRFLDHAENRWDFEPKDQWKILAGEVRRDAWQKRLGEKPTRFYPAGTAAKY